MADSRRFLLGVDAGNTVVKAVLFDTEGNQLALAKRTSRSLSPVPGHVERDPDELWRDAAAVIRECLQRSGVRPEDIVAIGCSGHGNGLYMLDRRDAALAAIQSMDARAIAVAESLKSGGRAADLHRLSGQEPWPSQTPTLLAWFSRHAPDVLDRTGTAFYCKDFINFCLTGVRSTDISDMTGAGLVNIEAGSYDDGLLRLYGLADIRDRLPPLHGPTEVVGRVTGRAAADTGLSEGTPVVAGLFDVVACALGSGAGSVGQASIIAGTWSINQVVTRTPVRDRRLFMMSAFGPNRFMAIESSATSAGNLEWYLREMGGGKADPDGALKACNRLVSEINPRRDDPFFHPFLYGSRFGAKNRAGFFGVAGWHREGHLVRALLEGVTFEHRRHVDVLMQTGVRFDKAALSGGGARSAVWPQMFADVLGVEIATVGCDETGALGAAIAAGVGAGLFPDIDAGVSAMTRPRAVFAPDPALREHYDARYETYVNLVEAMQPFWQQLAQARGEA